VVDNGSKIIIGADTPSIVKQDDSLLLLILKAYKWNRMLTMGKVKNIIAISKQENTQYTYVKKVLSLVYLSPKITQNILNGTQPRDLTVGKIFSCTATEWIKQ
jgi:hypothetical protein